ncbi:MAG TPA: hypothetical protein VK960_01375 [Acidimicrobiia bacterium]|nr:hypothetical protein [Acidimicrobiia bacterium]
MSDDRDRWVDRGVISFEQAERLEEAPPESPGGPRTVEVLGYFGAVALFIATIAGIVKVMLPEDPIFAFITGDIDYLQGGLVALAGAAVVFGTGYRFADRTGAVRRASGFLLLVGYGLAAIAFSLLLFDLDIDDFTPIVVLIPSAIVAVVGWQRLRSVPTQLALFAVAVSALQAILVLIQVEEYVRVTDFFISRALGGSSEPMSWISHAASVALGLSWIWLARTGTITPRNAGLLIGAVYAWIFSLALFGSADGWLVLTIALVAAYLWAATQWRTTVLAAVGAVGTIVLILQILTLVYDDAPGATDIILWYGIPGALAFAGVWLFSDRPTAGSAAIAPALAPPAPEPPPMPPQPE